MTESCALYYNILMPLFSMQTSINKMVVRGLSSSMIYSWVSVYEGHNEERLYKAMYNGQVGWLSNLHTECVKVMRFLNRATTPSGSAPRSTTLLPPPATYSQPGGRSWA